MNLVIEIGNTTIKFALIEGNKLSKFIRFKHKELNYEVLSSYSFEKAILSGSGNLELIDWEKINAKEKINFDRILLKKLHITYQTPETIGQDRLINAYYASILFPNKNNLIIDVGTCITFTFINKKSELEGGSISPGLRLRARSLHDFTSKLPLVSINEDSSSKLIGESTEESIISGIILGAIFEIEGRIEQYLAKFDDLSIIMTGGDTHFFQNKIKYQIFADTHFTLNGLNEILTNT
jgi:type III pantothenate kinase